MAFPFSAVIGAVSSIGASFLSNKGASARNESQIAQSQAQMDFQERMSSTAHQREVVDLRKAGLNPILSSKYGGSSTPSGAQAQIVDEITPGISSGLAARRLVSDVEKIESEVDNLEQSHKNLEEEELNTVEARHNLVQTRKNLVQQNAESQAKIVNLNANSALSMAAHNREQAATSKLQEEAIYQHLNTQILRSRAPGRMTESEIDKTWYGKALRYIMRANPLSGSAKGLLSK